jgi:hypothetical protein
MPEPILVMSSDTHLWKRAWARHQDLCDDSYKSLEQIVDLAVKLGVPLLLAGDIIDKQKPDPETVSVLVSQITSMESSGLALYYTQGQHEYDANTPWLGALSDWPTHIHEKTVKLDKVGGVSIYGLDWTPANAVKAKLAAVPRNTTLLVCHQVWTDFMGDKPGTAECSLSDVHNTRMVLTGDYHSHVRKKAKNAQGEPLEVFSPGSTCMQSIDEDPSKYVYVLSDDMSVASYKLDTRSCYRVILGSPADLDAFLASPDLKDLLAYDDKDPLGKPILDVLCSKVILDGHKRITAAVADKAFLFIRMDKEVTDISENLVSERIATGGLRACLDMVVEPGSQLFKDSQSLIDHPDPKAELGRIKAKFFEE